MYAVTLETDSETSFSFEAPTLEELRVKMLQWLITVKPPLICFYYEDEKGSWLEALGFHQPTQTWQVDDLPAVAWTPDGPPTFETYEPAAREFVNWVLRLANW